MRIGRQLCRMISPVAVRRFRRKVRALEAARSRARDDLIRQAEVARLIDAMRANEGDWVTVCADNPDFNGLPDSVVTCGGLWSNWQEQTYRADGLRDALVSALAAKSAAEDRLDRELGRRR